MEASLRTLLERWPVWQVKLALAECLVGREQFGSAIRLLTELQEHAQTTGHAPLLARVGYDFAAVYRSLGDAELATRFQQQALRFQSDLGPEDLLAHANDLILNRRYRAARSLIESALDLVDAPDSPHALHLWATFGVVLGLLGDVRAGIRCLIHVIRQRQTTGDLDGLSEDYHNLAALCEGRGWLRVALAFSRTAQQRAQLTDRPYLAARSRSQLERLQQLDRLYRLPTRTN